MIFQFFCIMESLVDNFKVLKAPVGSDFLIFNIKLDWREEKIIHWIFWIQVYDMLMYILLFFGGGVQIFF